MSARDHSEIIQKLPIWNEKISIKPLSGGITNFNYLVVAGKKKYVARFAPKANILLGLDRKQEINNTRIAASLGIGPQIIHFFPKHNLLIAEYLEGVIFTPEEGRKPANIKRLAQLFKKLHNGPKFKGSLDPFRIIEEYVGTARRKKSWLPSDIDRSLEKLKKIKAIVAPFYLEKPCHLDIMIENIVGNGKSIKLIDWEYSANSDPRFDLAMFSVKANFNAKQDALLLNAYGLKISRPEFEAMKAVVYFREGAWGLLQLAISKIPFDYKKYARDNIASFKAIVDKLSG